MDPAIVNLTKAIALTESGSNGVPNYNAVGDNGTSKGAYQWQPGNFEKAASSAGLDPKDFSPANQNKVAYAQVKAYRDQGLNPAQIAAAWNAGEKRAKDGSWETNVGTTTINGKPLHYDTPAYVQKVNDEYRQLAGATGNGGGYNPTPFSSPDSNSQFNLDLSGDVPAPGASDGSLGSKLHGRLEDASQALGKAASGQINPLSGILQTAGAGAGAINDTVGAGLDLIPGVKQAEGLIGKGANAAANTGVGKSLVKEGTDFATAHPEIAGDIGATGNIIGVLPAFKGAGIVKGAVDAVAGKALGKTALDATIEAVSPELKGKAAVSAAKQGLIKKPLTGEIMPKTTKDIQSIAQTVSETVPSFDKLGTFSEKLNAVKAANTGLAENLKNEVVQSGKDRIYSFKELNAKLRDIEKPIALKADPVLERQFDLARDAAIKIAKDEGGTVSSLFDARKGFDQLVEKQFPNLYERANAPMRDAITSIRDGMNEFIENNLPEGSGFREKLQQQSRLFRAIDNLAPKAAPEIGTKTIDRIAGRHPVISGFIKGGAKAVAGGGIAGEVFKHL